MTSGTLRILLAGVVAALIAFASSAQTANAALTTCNSSSNRPFAPWGDHSPYALAPNGDFEAGASGWSLSGARVVAGNNTHTSGSYSLSLPSGASAKSPAACVKLGDPASRFFLRSTSGTGKVRVDVVYKTLLGLPMTSTLGYATASGKWHPGPKFTHELENILATLNLSGLHASLQFKFTAISGSFQVDDLYVDPLFTI